MYDEHPHLEIERALLEARHAGARFAQITLHEQHASIEDDRNGMAARLHSQRISARLHPSAHRSSIRGRLAHHIVPNGLTVTLTDLAEPVGASPVTLSSLNDSALETADVDAQHQLYITENDRLGPLTLVNADGTSQPVTMYHYHGMGGYRYAESDTPGAPVTDRSLAAAVVAKADAHALDTEAARRAALTAAHAHMLSLSRHGTPENSNAVVWAQPHFKSLCTDAAGIPDDENNWPPTPSTSEYRSPDDDFIRQHLTPQNAVCADLDSVQIATIERAVKHNPEADLTIVRTSNTNVPAMRLSAARAVMLDGSTREFPVLAWDFHHQSGTYDSMPLPQGIRLDSSLMTRVQAITLELEIHRPDAEPERLSLRTDFYHDQDEAHHVVLITEDSKLDYAELEQLTHLHNINDDEYDLHLRPHLLARPVDWPAEYQLRALTTGAEAAARQLLEQAALTTAAAAIAAGMPDGNISADAVIGSCTVTVSVSRKPRHTDGIDSDQPYYQPLSNPIRTDGQDRELTADETKNLLQLGVNLNALRNTNRRRTADRIWDRLGFEQCSAAVALANSVPVEDLPPPTV